MCGTLVSLWEHQVRHELPELAVLPRPALVEPIRAVMARAAAALAEDVRGVPDVVAEHAQQRTHAGLGAAVVAGEYAWLRGVMIDAVFAVAPADAAHDSVVALQRVIDPWAAAAIATCLREVEATRERLVTILAHDLRTPLACIAMASELLTHDNQREAHLHAQITAAAERMERMVSDMLDLARRGNAQELPVAPKPDDLGAICRSVVDEIAVANPHRAIEVSASGDLRGQFDRDRVAQALSNLVRNAIEHGIGVVHVRAVEERDRQSLVLDVTNMRAANASGALPVYTQRADGRLGFGLYIVHKIAAAHGATCTHETTSVKTTYTIRWPR